MQVKQSARWRALNHGEPFKCGLVCHWYTEYAKKENDCNNWQFIEIYLFN